MNTINKPPILTSNEIIKKFNIKTCKPRTKEKPIEEKMSPLELAVFQYRDPLTSKRLTNAVVILPCTHRLNEETLNHIKCVAKDHFYIAPEESLCPYCKKNMYSYAIDYDTREKVKKLLESVVEDGIILQLPREPQEKWQGIKPAFPVSSKGEFKIDKNSFANNFSFDFMSQNDSVITSFFFQFEEKYKDSLQIHFKRNQGFEDYLWKTHDICLEDHQKFRVYFELETPTEMRKWWNLLVEHNNIPEQTKTEINQLLEKCIDGKPKFIARA